MQRRLMWAGKAGALPGTVARATARLRFVYQVSFRSPWSRLTWLVSGPLFLVILLLTGAIASQAAPAQFTFPQGTVRFSWAKGTSGGW
jgi:hypothetical protein